jgi:hypothetical protein
MEILRLPETTQIQAKFTVPAASQLYTIQYEDLITGSTYSASATSSSSKEVTFTLNSKYLSYSGNLFANVYSSASALVYSTGIDVVKPYCDITKVKGVLNITTAQCITAEKVARKMIEAEVGSFQFIRKQKEIIGMGLDYLPVNENIDKLYYLYENGVLVFDYSNADLDDYKISIDRTSIIYDDNLENKVEYQKVWADRNYPITFASGNDYLLDADFGYKVIPSDVEEACEILVQDVISNNMRYFSRNIVEFDNQEFRIKFADGGAFGTGNLLVDKILSRYKNRIIPGVI